ncbi:non-ribosomal peptide synthetase [Pseudomonas paralcaligenes]|uniref:non-ribosomal peptide synthetase n=1 Tax=Pseudomonas paralcaligenes TaxID=2772558 RepID=UPI001C80F473|nr:non-ribosomal peptide synthetase [Pseudomonas paralcaligenes]
MDIPDSLLEDDMLALLLGDLPTAPQVLTNGMPAVAVDGPLPLSFAQQRLWFLQQLDPASSAYNLPRVLHLEGVLDVKRLERALNRVIERHTILRTRFITQAGEPMQVVENSLALTLTRVSLRHLDSSALASETERRIVEESAQPFDLSVAPLIRANLLETGEHQHLLLLTMHHIVSDAWSNPLLVADLTQAYALPAGQGLPQLPRQYSDYAHWQRQTYPNTPAFTTSGAYWRNYLAGELTPLSLPYDHPRRPGQTHMAGYHAATLDAGLRQQLDALCREHKLQPMVVLLAAWQLLLGRYSGQSDFTVGIPSATRSHSETHELVGLFVSSLVFRARLDPCQSGLDLLQRLKQESLQALEHVDYPFELLLDDLDLQRSSLANPLFQTMFNWRVSSNDNAPFTLGELQVEMLDSGTRQSKFDLSLDVDHGSESTSFSLEYSTDLFEPASVARLAQHWQQLLLALVSTPQASLGELPMLAPAETHAILHGLNQTHQDYPGEFRIQRLFETQARMRPDATALIFSDKHLTYAQLDQRANRLAHALRAQGVGPETLVGIAAERSLEMVIALLAILKAGGAYVPLDPEYPTDRLAYMVEDSRIALLLTQPHLQAQLPIFDGTTLLLDQDFASYPNYAPDIKIEGEHLAYVIYTSGSTGKPKGAGNHHRALFNRLAWMQQAYRLDSGDRVMQKTPFSFDVSVWEFFWPLIEGACLVIASPGEHREPHKLIATIERHQVSTLHFVPSMLQVFMHEPGVERCTSLRRIVCSGEALQVDAQQQVFAKLPGAELYNLYGPTEAAIDVTHWTCRDEGLDSVPIGEPIANLYAHILDQGLGAVPMGVQGELLLGGEGLARGYHRRPALTAERFIPDPFAISPGARLYRTGDLARYRPNGVIDYCGRLDHQVKIRGLRIELGEIEARLLEQDTVRKAVVLAVESPTGLQLAAYVVPAYYEEDASAQANLRDILRAALRTNLPDYMVPPQISFLPELPITQNGKLDRRALSAAEALTAQNLYVPPATEMEKSVAVIWQNVLKKDKIGLGDHFFELGGHSLLATQVISRIRQELNIEASLSALFEHPQLSDFIGSLSTDQTDDMPALSVVDRHQPLPVSFAQQRQWFIWQMNPTSVVYHIRQAVKLTGKLDILALEKSFNALVQRHESLRTRFIHDGSRLVQTIDPTSAFKLQIASGTTDTSTKATDEFISTLANTPFDLTNDPLFRAGVITANDESLLIMVFHHIICDGWSIKLIAQELTEDYNAIIQQQPISRQALKLDYVDYCSWQRQWFDSARKDEQVAYWKEKILDPDTTLDLPFDRLRTPERSDAGRTITHHLTKALHDQVITLAKAHKATPFIVYLASFQALFHHYSGQHHIRIGVPIAGRNRSETERMVGLFVNTQVMCSTIDDMTDFSQMVNNARRHVIEAHQHQDLPFDYLVEALNPTRSTSYHPLFQVFLNYQVSNAKEENPELPLILTGANTGSDTTHFDLHLTLCETEDSVYASFTYACDLFDPTTVERMIDHWSNLLQVALRAPNFPIERLQIASEAEYLQVTQEWNTAQLSDDYPAHIYDMIAAQVSAKPLSVAIIDKETTFSFADIDRRVAALASTLVKHGVQKETRVAIAMQRSATMVIAILAVLRAGGTYVPLDLDYPANRLDYILKDSDARFLLSDEQSTLSLFDNHTAEGLLVHLAEEDFVRHAVYPNTHKNNLAYIIYTSGSTGLPKGVAITHANITALAAWSSKVYSADEIDGVLASTSICFDLSAWEILVTLANGGKIILAKNALEISDLPARNQVKLINTVPSAITALCRQQVIPQSVKTINLAGEPLKQSLVDELYELDHLSNVYDLYGPSEDTTYSTYARRTRGGSPTIGRPLPGTQAYILNEQLVAIPQALLGELYLAGKGVSRGYLNRPALTAERFVPDPFSTRGERLYRTGDMARFTQDGNLIYQGRKDHQIKIRGFRIELAEIESRLVKHPAISECTVLALENPAGSTLVAYIVPNSAHHLMNDAGSLPATLKSYLRQSLPDYMTPSRIIVLEALPLTSNGKLDRNKLIQLDQVYSVSAGTPPRNDFEAKIARAWQTALQVSAINIEDNFFELGGSSISAMLVVSTLRKDFGISLSLHDLMLGQTIAGITERAQLGGFKQPFITPLNTSRACVPPLYCIHPVGGSSYCYYPLALSLADLCPVMGVTFPEMVGDTLKLNTWEEIISTYTAAISADANGRDIQLLGWSLGGSIALEVAARLEGQGNRVSFLGLLDATTPEGCKWNAENIEKKSKELDTPPHLLEILVDYTRVLFPKHAQAVDQYFTSRADQLLDETSERNAFIEWCVENLDVNLQQAHSIVENIQTENQKNLSNNIYEKLNILSVAHKPQPLRIEPVCWWPAGEKSPETIAKLIEDLAFFTPQGKISVNLETPTLHNAMAYAPEFINSMVEIFEDTPQGR